MNHMCVYVFNELTFAKNWITKRKATENKIKIPNIKKTYGDTGVIVFYNILRIQQQHILSSWGITLNVWF